MSDVNEGSSFGGGNFPEFIARERERLRAEREQIFSQQKELQRKLLPSGLGSLTETTPMA